MSLLTLAQFLPYRLSVADNAVSDLISKSYRKRFKLKIPEWRVLAILAEFEKMTPQDIGNTGKLTKITIARAAAALVDRGLVRQSPNPADGRSHFLMLTPEGQALYDQIVPAALTLEASLLSGFSREERRLLDSLLRRLEAAANFP